MAGRIILCIVLLILAVILLTPVRVRVSYNQGELEARVRYGLIKLQLYPPQKSAGQKKKKKKKKAKPEPEEKKKKPKAKINREQIFYSLEKLPPVLGKALKRVGRRITITPLRVSLLVAGTDPADTASLYGRLSAALASGLPVLQRTVRIREQDIRLYPDFVGDRMDAAADVGISIRPWDVLVTGLCAGASLLKWLLGFRKLASPPPVEEEKEETGAEKDETTGKAA